jgi:GT2 family glycosyltransferase
VAHDTDGFSGGAVLLRPEMLDELGVFDPTFFAY